MTETNLERPPEGTVPDETDINLRAHFTRMSDERLKEYDASWSDEQLIEWDGEAYEETFWGQPKWPVFMTEAPNAAEVAGLESLRRHLEEKMMGSFSIAPNAIWEVENQKVANR